MQVSSSTPTAPVAPSQKFDSPWGQKLLKAISDKTGIGVDDLKSQLASGTSLGDILKAKGLTMHDIRQAMRNDGGGKAEGHRHHHHSGGEAVKSAIVDALSTALGMDKASLQDALKNGTSLEKIAADHGLSQTDLDSALEKAFQSLSGYSANGQPAAAAPVPAAIVNASA